MVRNIYHLLYVETDAATAERLQQAIHTHQKHWSIDHVTSIEAATARLKDGDIEAVVLPMTFIRNNAPAALRKAAPHVPLFVLTPADQQISAIAAYLATDGSDVASLVNMIDEALNDAQPDAIQQQLEGMERMMAVVGHELRTPLAGLRATTEFLLTDEAKEAAEWDPFLQLMHDEVIRMAELVNNMLEAARLNSGCTQWHWDDVKLSRVCDEALNVVRPLIDHRSVELHWNLQPPNLKMRGDPEAICRMIINFISNAAKHTTEGSITLDVSSQTRGGRPYVIFRFIDTGAGIPPSMIDKLGRAFVLNDGSIGSDYAKGVGLGLSICRGIVAAHGGEIQVASQPNRGSTFTVTLPADHAGPVEAEDTAIQSAAA